MRIISKYKDYYDYLSGIYGIDNGIVLDRRTKEQEEKQIYFTLDWSFDTKVHFYICGYLVEGYYKSAEKKYYWGEDLLKLGKQRKSIYSWERLSTEQRGQNNYTRDVLIDNNRSWERVSMDPLVDKRKLNEKVNCPILCCSKYGHNDYYLYPKLTDIDFHKVYDADTMWKMVYNWSSDQKTVREQVSAPLDENARLESRGFDKKISFRHRKE